MSEIISSQTTPKGTLIEVVRRVRRHCIETRSDGTVHITSEQEDVTFVDGVPVGAGAPAGVIVLPHDEAMVLPDVMKALDSLDIAADDKRATIKKAAQEAAIALAAARADAEMVVVTDK